MLSIGVDLGGTNIAVGLVNEAGEIVSRASLPTRQERGEAAIFADVAMLCEEVAVSAGGMAAVSAVGIGTPGVVDLDKGLILSAVNLGFKEVDAAAALKPRFAAPVFVENDANCAALGESVSGAAKGYDSSVTITLGTGIGGGVVLGGKIYRGAFFGAGEIGHHVICAGGEPCNCGRRGCFEAYASATGLIRMARALAKEEPHGGLAESVNGDLSAITAKTAFDAADAGDKSAMALIERYIDYVAEGLANVVNILQPHALVIGGGVGARGERLTAPLQERTRARALATGRFVDVVPAKLGNDAGIVGAAMVGMK